MDRRTPNYIQTRQSTHGYVHSFPPRDLGKARGLGVAFIIFGLFTTAFMTFWMIGPIRSGWNNGDNIEWFPIIFGLLGTPGIVVGLGLIFFGFGIVNNWLRCEVIVSGDTLTSIERVGPLRWKRKRPLADVERFVLTDAMSSRNAQDSEVEIPASLQNLAAIRVEGDTIKPMLLAPGFSRALLEPFAKQLAEAAGAKVPTRLVDHSTTTHIEVVNEEPGSKADPDTENPLVFEQPVDSTVVFQGRSDGVSFAVPPAGLFKGSKGLFAMAILWNGIIGLVAGGIAYGHFKDGDKINDLWIPALFISAFVAVGVGLLMAAINMGRRQAAIVTRGGELMIKRTGPFKSRDDAWRAEELSAIRVGPSGMSVNDVPVMELQIHPKEGKKTGLLSQLDDEELDWIAAHLRKALKVGKR